MKKFRKIVPMFIVLVLIMSLASVSFAFEFDGKNIDGVQVGEKFYSLQYIVNNTDEFALIIGNAPPASIILDLNGKSAKLSDYTSSGTTEDFDTWASEEENQTEPNPQVFVDGEGNENQVAQENDTKIKDAAATNAVLFTTVTGKYASDVTKVEVIFGDTIKEATLEDDGTFSYNIVPILDIDDKVTIKGYVDDELVDTDVIAVGDKPPVQEDDTKIEDAVAKNAVLFTTVTGKYADDVTKVEIIFNGTTNKAALEDGTFTYSITPMLSKGSEITIKGYVGDDVVDTDTVTVEEEPQEEFKVIDIQ